MFTSKEPGGGRAPTKLARGATCPWPPPLATLLHPTFESSGASRGGTVTT